MSSRSTASTAMRRGIIIFVVVEAVFLAFVIRSVLVRG
jgi:hypothetical protein